MKRLTRIQLAQGHYLEFIGGAKPYIWIGDKICCEVVPDKDVRRLKNMCNEVLRKLNK